MAKARNAILERYLAVTGDFSPGVTVSASMRDWGARVREDIDRRLWLRARKRMRRNRRGRNSRA